MNRTEIINYLIDIRNYKQYLEIGVQNESQNFAQIRCAHKVGVDPRPVTTFQGISDAFFAQNKEEFDLVFIDGLHTEEQVIKDVENALKCLKNNGVIILHDCMPPDAWHQREPENFNEGEEWNGTVWKAALRIFNQTAYRCTLLDTDWGCGLIDTAKSQAPIGRELPELLNYEQHYTWLLAYKKSVAAYLRDQVKVFYHLACMGNWQEVFREQMLQLQQSGFEEIDLTILGTEEQLQTVDLICQELHLKTNIIFQDPELTLFERLAIFAIEKYAQQNEGFVLYLHSKGVSDPNSLIKTNWRQLMMRELVEKWADCLLKLPYYDIIGVDWRDAPPHFSGNFWYAKTNYLRKLKDFKQFYEDSHVRFLDPFDSKRLSCEFWIGSSNEIPHVLSLVCRNVDFYNCTDDFWESENYTTN